MGPQRSPYKGLFRVTVGSDMLENTTVQWPQVPGTGLNLKPCTGNGDIFI